jgi:hypothetical protein
MLELPVQRLYVSIGVCVYVLAPGGHGNLMVVVLLL